MMIVVTGGSGSGKSAYAEDLATAFGDAERFYIATMYPFDEESRQRVKRHQRMRFGKGFTTIECYTGLKNLSIPLKSVVLLECMSNLAANEMFQKDGAGIHTVDEVLAGIRHLKERTAHLIIVTNEIFSEAVSYGGDTETYQEYLGKINCVMAGMADQVVEVVYGIPVFHKGKAGILFETPME